MRPFRGNLAHYRLQLLVPALLSPRVVSGTLRLERGDTWRELHLLEGLVVGVGSNAPGEHLGQVLADLGVLGAEEAAAAFAQAEEAGQSLGQWLLDHRVLAPRQLALAMEFKTRLTLLEAYAWESGDVELTPSDPVLPQGAVVPLHLAGVHRELSGQLPLWRRFRAAFPRLDAPVQVGRPPPAPAPEAAGVLQLARAGAPVRQLLAALGTRPSDAARKLLGLCEQGALVPQGSARPAERSGVAALVARARALLARGEAEEAARLASQALEQGPVPEGNALYREAARAQTQALERRLATLCAAVRFPQAPARLPVELTSDDLYLLGRLRQAPQPSAVLREVRMGALAAFRSLRRLEAAGLVALEAR